MVSLLWLDVRSRWHLWTQVVVELRFCFFSKGTTNLVVYSLYLVARLVMFKPISRLVMLLITLVYLYYGVSSDVFYFHSKYCIMSEASELIFKLPSIFPFYFWLSGITILPNKWNSFYLSWRWRWIPEKGEESSFFYLSSFLLVLYWDPHC